MLQHVDGYGRKYNPDRDITHLYQNLARAAFYRMTKVGYGPVMAEFARFMNVTEEDLAVAGAALARFVAVSKRPEHTTIQDAMDAAGFDAIKPAALVAVMWHIGVEATGAFHKYAREAFPMYQNAPGSDFLREASERLVHLTGKDSPRVKDRLAADMKVMLDVAEQNAKVGKT
jgi:hypothetical protein